MAASKHCAFHKGVGRLVNAHAVPGMGTLIPIAQDDDL